MAISPGDERNIIIDASARFERVFVLKLSDGSPFDTTGYNARGQIREYAGGPLVASFTTAFMANGLSISLSSATTKAMRRGGVYSVELVSPDGEVQVLISGRVALRPEVTLP